MQTKIEDEITKAGLQAFLVKDADRLTRLHGCGVDSINSLD
jgi:hypothetical protein